MSEINAKSFKVPKIRRQESKDNLRPVDVNSRDCRDLEGVVKRSYLSSNYQTKWQVKSAAFVDNRQLETAYRTKKSEMKEGRHTRDMVDQYAFLVIKEEHRIPLIVKNGLRCGTTKQNFLGDYKMGIYLWRNADVQLKLCESWNLQTCALLVFKIVLGKCKSMSPVSGDESVEPTPNFDCHIPQFPARPSDMFHQQMKGSQVYLYEYTEDCEPSPYPRQCLPYAIVTYESSGTGPTSNITPSDSYSKRPTVVRITSSDPDIKSNKPTDPRLKGKESATPSDDKTTLSKDLNALDPNDPRSQLSFLATTSSQSLDGLKYQPSFGPDDKPECNSQEPEKSVDTATEEVDMDIDQEPEPAEPLSSLPPITLPVIPDDTRLLKPDMYPRDPRLDKSTPGMRMVSSDPRLQTTDSQSSGYPPEPTSDPRLRSRQIPTDPRSMYSTDPRSQIAPSDPRLPKAPSDPRLQKAPYGFGIPHASSDSRLPSFPSDPRLQSMASDSKLSSGSLDPRLQLQRQTNQTTSQPSASTWQRGSNNVRTNMTKSDEPKIRKKLSLSDYKKKVNITKPDTMAEKLKPHVESENNSSQHILQTQYVQPTRHVQPTQNIQQIQSVQEIQHVQHIHNQTQFIRDNTSIQPPVFPNAVTSNVLPSYTTQSESDILDDDLFSGTDDIDMRIQPIPSTVIVTKPIDVKKPIEVTKPVDVIKPIEITKPIEKTIPIEAVKPIEITKPMEVINEENDIVEEPDDMAKTLNDLSDPDDESQSPKPMEVTEAEEPEETVAEEPEPAAEDPMLAEAMQKLVEHSGDVTLFTEALRELQESAEEFGEQLTDPEFLVKKIAEKIEVLSKAKKSEVSNEIVIDDDVEEEDVGIRSPDMIMSPERSGVVDMELESPVKHIPLETITIDDEDVKTDNVKSQSGSSLELKSQSRISLDLNSQSGHSLELNSQSRSSLDLKGQPGTSLDQKHQSGSSLDVAMQKTLLELQKVEKQSHPGKGEKSSHGSVSNKNLTNLNLNDIPIPPDPPKPKLQAVKLDEKVKSKFKTVHMPAVTADDIEDDDMRVTHVLPSLNQKKKPAISFNLKKPNKSVEVSDLFHADIDLRKNKQTGNSQETDSDKNKPDKRPVFGLTDEDLRNADKKHNPRRSINSKSNASKSASTVSASSRSSTNLVENVAASNSQENSQVSIESTSSALYDPFDLDGSGDLGDIGDRAPRSNLGDIDDRAQRSNLGDIDDRAQRSNLGDIDDRARKSKVTDIDVRVPTSSQGDLDIRAPTSSQGDIDARAQTSSQSDIDIRAPTRSQGDIDVRAQTSSQGDIDVRAQTRSKGDIDVRAQTSSQGDIDVRAQTRSKGDIDVRAQTRSKGDIDVRVATSSQGYIDGGDVDFRTENSQSSTGDVDLRQSHSRSISPVAGVSARSIKRKETTDLPTLEKAVPPLDKEEKLEERGSNTATYVDPFGLDEEFLPDRTIAPNTAKFKPNSEPNTSSDGLFDAYNLGKSNITRNEFGDIDWRMTPAAGDVDLRSVQNEPEDGARDVPPVSKQSNPSSIKLSNNTADPFVQLNKNIQNMFNPTPVVSQQQSSGQYYASYKTSDSTQAYSKTSDNKQLYGKTMDDIQPYGKIRDISQQYAKASNTIDSTQPYGHYKTSQVPEYRTSQNQSDIYNYTTSQSQNKPEVGFQNLIQQLDFSNLKNILATVQQPSVNDTYTNKKTEDDVKQKAYDDEEDDKPAFVTGLSSTMGGRESYSRKYGRASKLTPKSSPSSGSERHSTRSGVKIPGFDISPDSDSQTGDEKGRDSNKSTNKMFDKSKSDMSHVKLFNTDLKSDGRSKDLKGSESLLSTPKSKRHDSPHTPRELRIKESNEVMTPLPNISYQAAILESMEQSALKVRHDDSMVMSELEDSPLILRKPSKNSYKNDVNEKTKEETEGGKKPLKIEIEKTTYHDDDDDDDDEVAGLVIDLSPTARTPKQDQSTPTLDERPEELVDNSVDLTQDSDEEIMEVTDTEEPLTIDFDSEDSEKVKKQDKEPLTMDLDDEDNIQVKTKDEMTDMIEQSRKNMVIKLKGGGTKRVNPKTGKAYSDITIGSAIEVIGKSTNVKKSSPQIIHPIHGIVSGTASSGPVRSKSPITHSSSDKHIHSGDKGVQRMSSPISNIVSGINRPSSPINVFIGNRNQPQPVQRPMEYIHPITGKTVKYGTTTYSHAQLIGQPILVAPNQGIPLQAGPQPVMSPVSSVIPMPVPVQVVPHIPQPMPPGTNITVPPPNQISPRPMFQTIPQPRPVISTPDSRTLYHPRELGGHGPGMMIKPIPTTSMSNVGHAIQTIGTSTNTVKKTMTPVPSVSQSDSKSDVFDCFRDKYEKRHSDNPNTNKTQAYNVNNVLVNVETTDTSSKKRPSDDASPGQTKRRKSTPDSRHSDFGSKILESFAEVKNESPERSKPSPKKIKLDKPKPEIKEVKIEVKVATKPGDESELEDGEISDDSMHSEETQGPSDRRVVQTASRSSASATSSGTYNTIPTIGSRFQESPKRIVNICSNYPRPIPTIGARSSTSSAYKSAGADWADIIKQPETKSVERVRSGPSGSGPGYDDAASIVSKSAASITKTRQKSKAQFQVKTLDDWLKLELEIDNIEPLQKIIPYALNTDLTKIPKQRKRRIRMKVKNAIAQEGSKGQFGMLINVEPMALSDEEEETPPPLNPNYAPEVTSAQTSIELKLLVRVLTELRKKMSNVYGTAFDVGNVRYATPGTAVSEALKIVGALTHVETEMKLHLSRTTFHGYPHRRVPDELLLASELGGFKSEEEDVFLILMIPLSTKPYNKLLDDKNAIHGLHQRKKRKQSPEELQKLQNQISTRHKQRQAVLRGFTGYLNKKRLQKLQEAVNKYTLVYDHFKCVHSPPVADSMLKFIRTTQMDLRQHLILAKQYLALDEQKQK